MTDREELGRLASRLESHTEWFANQPMNMTMAEWNSVSNDFLEAAAALRRLAEAGTQGAVAWLRHKVDGDGFTACDEDADGTFAVYATAPPPPSVAVPSSPQDDVREALREAYIAGATAVHNEWVSAAERGDSPPRGEPDFNEAASDYAALRGNQSDGGVKARDFSNVAIDENFYFTWPKPNEVPVQDSGGTQGKSNAAPVASVDANANDDGQRVQTGNNVVTGGESAATTPSRPEVSALADIATERNRQREVEGWTLEHDDAHVSGELAMAGACYALASFLNTEHALNTTFTRYWPWDRKWWKPNGEPRRNLVKAGALIVAEIERLDRAAKYHMEGR